MKKYIIAALMAIISTTGFAASLEQITTDVTRTVTAQISPVVDEIIVADVRRSLDTYLSSRIDDGSITSYVIIPLTFQPENISATNGLTVRVGVMMHNTLNFSYIEIIANPVDNKTNSRGVR